MPALHTIISLNLTRGKRKLEIFWREAPLRALRCVTLIFFCEIYEDNRIFYSYILFLCKRLIVKYSVLILISSFCSSFSTNLKVFIFYLKPKLRPARLKNESQSQLNTDTNEHTQPYLLIIYSARSIALKINTEFRVSLIYKIYMQVALLKHF